MSADGELTLVCTITCETAPFSLERRMTLDAEAPRLRVDETIVNVGDEGWECTWGHHIVLGAPFLEEGCRFEPAAGTLETITETWEDTARLEPGQHGPWPHARLRAGGTVDLRYVPGPDAESHDDVYLTRLSAGALAVTNPRLGRTFRLAWDPEIFRWIVAWQPYGGAKALPLAGTYALGVEPWVARTPLAAAAAAGQALEIEAGGTLQTSFEITLEDA